MRDHDLSDEQKTALASGVRLVEAGPGAGKTKTVVARLREGTNDGRAIALLSFTNAAVDVARSRCRDEPALLEPPNFIGTFDQFFHRYVLTPATRRQVGKSPIYLSSWDDLPRHLATVPPPKGGVGIRLSRFGHHEDRGWEVDESRLNRTEKQTWSKLYPSSRKQLTEAANKRIKGLHSSHVYDTSEARLRALAVLQKSGEQCLQRLARRFGEIIVDEFQDCDGVEHQLLDLLHAAGIHVVGVADPDQAIYEFRQTTNQVYERFRDRLDPEEISSLTTCYRSTPAICSLVTSLRSVGRSEIVADPDHIGGADVIHVVVGSGTKAGSAASELVGKYGISRGNTRVIAHRKSDARILIQAGAEPPRGTSRMEVLLASLSVLRSGVEPHARLAAARKIESFILDQFCWPADAHVDVQAHRLETVGVTADQLRGLVSTLLSTSDSWDSASACAAGVRSTLESFAAGVHGDLVAGLGRRLVIPEKVWRFWDSRKTASGVNTIDKPRWGHVHGVKGDEFDAVVLAIPAKSSGSTHVLDDWENDRNTEQRRVLYVGASRARRVLVLVVPKSRKSQLERILSNAGIVHTIVLAH